MELNLENTVNYHYDKFPPESLNYGQFIEPLLKATDAVARYDQMLNFNNQNALDFTGDFGGLPGRHSLPVSTAINVLKRNL